MNQEASPSDFTIEYRFKPSPLARTLRGQTVWRDISIHDAWRNFQRQHRHVTVERVTAPDKTTLEIS